MKFIILFWIVINNIDTPIVLSKQKNILQELTVDRNITIADYFGFMDSVVTKYNATVEYQLTEHLLVRANPWIIDTLINTDYYSMKKKDSFIGNQRKMIVLKQGQRLKIPSSRTASTLLNTFKNTWIDINIPEFKLRVYQDSMLIFTCPVRVGQDSSKYLAINNRITDLRTKHGQGTIIGYEKNPTFFNPKNGEQFFFTKRDDGQITLMPTIPWIETEINGVHNGQLIHPTTNPKTLSKAYSNGCIGTREGDAWKIYYYAPLRTRIHIRYDLKISDTLGNKIVLDNIYNYNKL